MEKKEVLEASINYFDGDELSAKVWMDKYALKDRNGNFLEKDPSDMHRRLAKEFARIEAKYPNPMNEEEIFDLLEDFRYVLPQGSPMYGVGNNHTLTSLSNCFVIGNNGNADSYGSIMRTDEEQIQLMKRRGGVGHDISHLRPTGSFANNSVLGGLAGSTLYMNRYSNSTREVAQDGRRGALMLSIDVRHPDSEAFIDAKLTQGKVTGANISVKIRNDFMQAVEANDFYLQRFPIDLFNSVDINSNQIKDVTNNGVIGKLYPVIINDEIVGYVKKIRAKTLWDKIITNAHASAEPGVFFWDKILEESPADCYGGSWKTLTTNPCFPASEYLLTENGYVTFGDLYKSGVLNRVVCDNRISYEKSLDNIEHPENWLIDTNKSGTIIRNASEVFLTQKNANIIKITTKNGFNIKCTLDHHIATTVGMVEAQNISEEHNILISVPENNGSILNKLPITINEKMALLIGLIMGDGTFEKNRKRVHLDFWGEDKERVVNIVTKIIDDLFLEFGEKVNGKNKKLSKYFISSGTKNKLRVSSAWLYSLLNEYGYDNLNKFNIPKFIMNNSSTNIGKFFIAGIMYCDGSVHGSKKSGYTIRLSQSNKELLEKVQMILHSNGMIFGIYKRRDNCMRFLPDGNGGKKEYNTKAQYDLISLNGSFVKYRETIGFLGDQKKETKMNVIHNFKINKSYYDTLLNKKHLDNEDVYCIKEDIGRNIITNCISVRRCGEIPLCAYDSCRLLALNLLSYVRNPFTLNASFDFVLFKEHVRIAQRIMDDLVDLEIEKLDAILNKIDRDPESDDIKLVERTLWEKIKEKAVLGRRTGLGVTAEGDMMAALNLIYGSPESISFAEKVHMTLAIESYHSSIDMACERGAFPIWDAETEKNNPFINRVLNKMDQETVCKYTENGRRNISNLTIAPTGTTSLMTQTTSGIEPLFYPWHTRRRKTEKKELASFIDENGDMFEEYRVFHKKFVDWFKITIWPHFIPLSAVRGAREYLLNCSLEQLMGLFVKSPYYGATSNDINWEASVELQGRVQKWVDHSISKTINLPANTSVQTVNDLYLTAYHSGCKGITVYRDGSRSGILLADKQDIKEDVSEFKPIHALKRPKDVKCDIYFPTINKEKYIVLVGLVNEFPYEVFAYKIKDGSDSKNRFNENILEGITRKRKSGWYDLYSADGKTLLVENLSMQFEEPAEEDKTRLISGWLRTGGDIRFVVDTLNKSKGDLTTFSKVIARQLKRYVKDGEKSSEKCPKCGDNLTFEEGCLHCKSCGYSRCG